MIATVDPYDIQAMEKAVNDSAVRVSTIWVTHLIFGLYLAIAVSGITPRQLLLAQSIQLPILNIQLPLVSFFLVAPLLFVTLHVYVLLQFVLLARTASVYNEAVHHHIKGKLDQMRVRQRLANTLFAQLLAGSPREREGALGILLKIIAWLTLIIGPALLLFFFDLRFLAFHSHLASWCHRVLISIDLLLILILWHLALSPKRDVGWITLFEIRFGLAGAAALAALITIVLTFPGEFHSKWTRLAPHQSDANFGYGARLTECDFANVFSSLLPAHFDRLNLDGEAFIDQEKLEKIEARSGDVYAFASERTVDLSNRDLSCGSFQGADFRRADLSNDVLVGVHFNYANLRGAELENSNLEGADLGNAKLEDTDLSRSQFIGANLDAARMDRAWLVRSKFQGAVLTAAQLQEARIENAEFQGANLDSAALQGVALYHVAFQGASFLGAHLQATLFKDAHLQGAGLSDAGLQGAYFQSSDLEAASFRGARLQGSEFTRDTKLALANFSDS